MSRPRALGAITLAAALGVMVLPATAAADISCAYVEAGPAGSAANVLSISATTSDADVVAVQRSGDQIAVSNDAMGQQVACAGPTPTVNNIDTINFSGAPFTSLAIDLRGGQFAPGASDAGLGPEIEWNLDWSDGFLVVNSAPGTDAIGVGLAGGEARANLNRAFEDPWDAEVALGGLQNVLLRGDGGDELLSVSGSFAPFDEFSGPFDRPSGLVGNGGSDLLLGGSAIDLIDAGGGADTIDAGDGRDEVDAGGGDDTIRARDGARDRIACGRGHDKVKADRRDKLVGC